MFAYSEKSSTFALAIRQKTFPKVSSDEPRRGVAQLVSVRVWGACGRWFESSHPDLIKEVQHMLSLFFVMSFLKDENDVIIGIHILLDPEYSIP